MTYISQEQGWPGLNWLSGDAAISLKELRDYGVYADVAALCMLLPDLSADCRVSIAETLRYTLSQVDAWAGGGGDIDPSTAQARVDALGRVGQLILSDERSN